jgi:hypothetical protein
MLLNRSVRGPRMGPCLIVAGSFRVTCQDARGPWAGATIAVLGGLRAEEVSSHG